MNYRGEVGPAKLYDVIGAQQFCVMIKLGLREHHKLLDFGCGSLRGGRLFIPYLLPGNYYGVEPNAELVYEGIKGELGIDILDVKKPHFYDFADFKMSRIGQEFDFILAQSILSHAGVDILDRIISEASRALAENGKFAATFFSGELNRSKSGWLGHDIASYTLSYMKHIAGKHGMHVAQLEDIAPGVTHPIGQKWIVFRHQ